MPMTKSPIPKAVRDRFYYLRNKERIQEYKRGYYQKNRQRWQEKKLAQYGLTPESYTAMAEAQSYKCVICNRPAAEDRDGVLHVDHNHATGEVRGLLCSQCNVALGLLQDSAELLRKAASYLDRRI